MKSGGLTFLMLLFSVISFSQIEAGICGGYKKTRFRFHSPKFYSNNIDLIDFSGPYTNPSYKRYYSRFDDNPGMNLLLYCRLPVTKKIGIACGTNYTFRSGALFERLDSYTTNGISGFFGWVKEPTFENWNLQNQNASFTMHGLYAMFLMEWFQEGKKWRFFLNAGTYHGIAAGTANGVLTTSTTYKTSGQTIENNSSENWQEKLYDTDWGITWNAGLCYKLNDDIRLSAQLGGASGRGKLNGKYLGAWTEGYLNSSSIDFNLSVSYHFNLKKEIASRGYLLNLKK